MSQKATDKLEKAFFDFLEEKSYKKISVTELIERAGVSRTTFYRHYVDIYDMYEKVCDKILARLIQELFAAFNSEASDNLTEMFSAFYDKLDSQKKYIVLLCGENGDRLFFEHALEIVLSYSNLLSDRINRDEYFALKFVALSGIGSYIKSLMYDTEYPSYFLPLSKRLLTAVQERKGW